MTASDPLDEIRGRASAPEGFPFAEMIRTADPESTWRRLAESAQDVPVLLAAVEAVLAKADEWEGASVASPLVTRGYAAECFRAAIIRELSGEEPADG